MSKRYFYEQVRQFHETFGHPEASVPQPLELDRAVKRSVWTAEEAVVEFLHQSARNEEEFLQAVATFQQGFEQAVQKSLQDAPPTNDVERLVGQGDALTDALYFVMGSFVELGLDPVPLFEIVQRANMAKLGPDGKPILRASDNKVMKPEGWLPPEPELEAEVRRQLEAKQ
ncbi:hypothetical protein EVJ33_10945 [Exiguobacterium sp. SL-10]|uniref:hypothetical protein n=1 Tax=Exiguobacterium sp. SL-10 TaxID=2510962 RepID=UPI00103B5D95|nr:hypothetical protein [Exiguobacterium sp. SL-10]TCI29147.1 hypothetical protein EVJ33_10945 [Exiguobacterium sp. SL-10]